MTEHEPQAQLSHRNYRVREQVMHTVSMLQDKYADEMRSTGSVVKIAGCLADSQHSVRQVAFDTLQRLSNLYTPASFKVFVSTLFWYFFCNPF